MPLRLPDADLLRRSTELDGVIFTMDDDFYAVSAEAAAAGTPFSGVVYAHPLQITFGQAVRDLELMAKVLEPEEMRNQLKRIPP